MAAIPGSTIVRNAIKDLVEGKAPTVEQTKQVVTEMFEGKASPAQSGAYLVAARAHPTTPEVLDACASIMLQFATPCDISGAKGPTIDVVGTGGDGMDTFNVSTASGFVLAACGGVVAKHGNRSSSGSVGSADFLEALGARIDLDGTQTATVVQRCGFGFLFAQMFHPSMRHVASVRKEIGVRTMFNLLGPLTNPSKPTYQVTGVASKEMGHIFAKLFALRKLKSSLVVHSHDGTNEISPEVGTHAWFVRDGVIEEKDISPADFGLDPHPLTAVCGGSPKERAEAFRRALGGEEGALRDYILLNCSAALVVAGLACDFKAGVAMAREAMCSGRASDVVDRYVAITRAIKEEQAAGATTAASAGTILEKIVVRRRADVAAAKSIMPLEELKMVVADAPAPKDFATCLQVSEKGHVAVIAEVKRASPSRGDIAPGIDAGEQAVQYANAGAAAISVLTEPTWFKGDLNDMSSARAQTQAALGDKRPAILRKDFIIDEYQVYEARAAGADTLLLIVACLDDDELKHLLSVSRELGMEPLVEVATSQEMSRALAVGSRVIGINNRDLHSFTVDMSRTERLIQGASSSGGVLMVALSGIACRADVQRYTCSGACAVLVGESLMKAKDPGNKIRELQGLGDGTIVKICGIRTVDQARDVAKAGADIIGLVFANKSPRFVDNDTAKAIVDAIRGLIIGGGSVDQSIIATELSVATTYQDWSSAVRRCASMRPLVFGVFADQDPAEVLSIAHHVGLDVVQLSGKEGMDAAPRHVPFPVVKAVHVGTDQSSEGLTAALASYNGTQDGPKMTLLDTKDAAAMGGTGKAFDWSIAVDASSKLPLFLAGGLSPDNIQVAVDQVGPFGVDISSGVEQSPGIKDIEKVTKFVRGAKKAASDAA